MHPRWDAVSARCLRRTRAGFNPSFILSAQQGQLKLRAGAWEGPRGGFGRGVRREPAGCCGCCSETLKMRDFLEGWLPEQDVFPYKILDVFKSMGQQSIIIFNWVCWIFSSNKSVNKSQLPTDFQQRLKPKIEVLRGTDRVSLVALPEHPPCLQGTEALLCPLQRRTVTFLGPRPEDFDWVVSHFDNLHFKYSIHSIVQEILQKTQLISFSLEYCGGELSSHFHWGERRHKWWNRLRKWKTEKWRVTKNK